METAEIAFEGWDIPVHADPRLRECNYGALNGGRVADVEIQRQDRIDQPFPGGESYRDVVDRVEDFLSDLRSEWDGKRVVVIGHSATRWALDHLLLGASLQDLVAAPFGWREGWHYSVK